MLQGRGATAKHPCILPRQITPETLQVISCYVDFHSAPGRSDKASEGRIPEEKEQQLNKPKTSASDRRFHHPSKNASLCDVPIYHEMSQVYNEQMDVIEARVKT
eukprot:1158816-Pelagomonas_calceolata.AAC.7